MHQAAALAALWIAVLGLAQPLGAVPAFAEPPPQWAGVPQTEESSRSKRAVSLYFGQSNPGNFTSILTQPWTTSTEDTWHAGASVSHLVWELGENTWIDGEVGFTKRFGDSDAWEAFGLVFLRWDGVPWSDWLYTSFGIGIGPSFATEISDTELRKSGNDRGSRTLNMLVPEVEFALPDHTDTRLVFRLHHRSGIFGIFSGVSGGSTFMTGGVRVDF